MRPRGAQRFSRAGIAMSAHKDAREGMAESNRKSGTGAKSLLAVMVASVFLNFAMPDAAFAASRSGGRVGGRVGGSSFSRSAPRASAPRASATRVAPRSSGKTVINNNYGGGYGGYGGGRTNVIISPSVGFGYSPFGFGGLGLGYGGFGIGGFGFGYNPALSLGLTFADVLIREQQR